MSWLWLWCHNDIMMKWTNTDTTSAITRSGCTKSMWSFVYPMKTSESWLLCSQRSGTCSLKKEQKVEEGGLTVTILQPRSILFLHCVMSGLSYNLLAVPPHPLSLQWNLGKSIAVCPIFSRKVSRAFLSRHGLLVVTWVEYPRMPENTWRIFRLYNSDCNFPFAA